MVLHTHRVINTGKYLRQAGEVLFASERFNNLRVSREKLERAKKVDEQLMMCDIVNSTARLHNSLCKHTSLCNQAINHSIYKALYKQQLLVKVKVNVDLYSTLLEHTSKMLRYGMRSQGISQFYLHTPCTSANEMNHTCLCLPSRSWYSFTDPGGMEG